MQNKNYLLPLLGGLGVVIGIIGLFLTGWILTSGTSSLLFGFFTGFEEAAAPLTGASFTLSPIWATLSMITLIIGLVAVAFNIIMSLLKGESNDGMIGKVLAWIAGIALVLFIVFGLVFTISNSGTNASSEALGFSFGIGYWLGLIGLAFGTFFAFIGSCMKKA